MKNGKGVLKSDREAFNWFAKASAAGNVYGHYNLANSYATGQGTPPNLPEALRLAKLARTSDDAKLRARADRLIGQLAAVGVR